MIFSAACCRWFAASTFGGSASSRCAASRSRPAAWSSFAIDFFRFASASINQAALARDGFGELAGDVPIFFEVAAPDREDLDAKAAQLAEGTPDRGDIEPLLGSRVGEDGHEVPVAVGAVRLAGAAAKEPHLLGLEHLDDAIDDAGRNGCGGHAEIVLVVEAAGVEGEVKNMPRQPAREVSETCEVGRVAGCDGVADPCNGSLQVVAHADPVAESLDQARATWLSGRDGRRLRRELLRLLAAIEDSDR